VRSVLELFQLQFVELKFELELLGRARREQRFVLVI
jgi:hypothetical protein